jgi:predicted nucleotidyltransferase
MSVITRPVLLTALRQALEQQATVLAAWEGGSAAFGSDDALSDIDAVAVVANDSVELTFNAVEAELALLAPIALRYLVPSAPGYAQRFYRLQGAPEHLVVDLVFIRESDPLLFREVELHGHGLTWFDRAGVLTERHLDAEQDTAQARARIAALRAAFDMFQHIPAKERQRGRAVDALTFYQGMTLRPLAEALRLLHCPQRRVFGVRYLARDVPADVCQRFEALSFVRDLQDLEAKHAQAQAWFWQCLHRLEAEGPGAARTGDAT